MTFHLFCALVILCSSLRIILSLFAVHTIFCFTMCSFQAFREILNWFSSYLVLCWYCVVLQATPVVSCFKTCNLLAWWASAVGDVLLRVSGSFFRSFIRKFTQIHLGLTFQFFLCPADRRWLVALWHICFAGNFNQTLQSTLGPFIPGKIPFIRACLI